MAEFSDHSGANCLGADIRSQSDIADIARPTGVPVVVIYVATIFLSAALLFAIQPIVAKLALPRLGGAPAVWTVAMLFFQAVLLAGYVYAHVLTRHVGLARQPWIHGLVLLAGAAFLPIALPEAWDFDPDAPITGQVLVLFALAVGVPFFALSANAPLLQRWYASTGARDAADPYFLYAASNVGSVAALLGYPLIAEPMIGVSSTSWIWAAGYAALILGMATCAVWVRESSGSATTDAAAKDAIQPKRFLIWIALAAIPSSMMLSTTQIIATDIGSFPLLWVIPLALYLLSFVIAFSARLKIPDGVLTLVFLVAVIFAVLMLAQNRLSNLGWGGFVLMLTAFMAVALMFHIRLYQDRPKAASLTSFYLAMSIGGVLGGIFNALLAPLLFNDLLEAHIVLAVVGLALRGTWSPVKDIGTGLVLLAVLVGIDYAAKALDLPSEAAFVGASVITLMALLTSRTRPLRFCVLATGLLVTGYLAAYDNTLHRARSFFGIYRVYDSDDAKVRSLTHGTTIHGTQYLKDLGQVPEVLSYYHRNGPMAQVVQAAAPDARIGIVGLGVGALACFQKPGQAWTFYEIDAAIDDIARDPDLFSYMDQCGRDMPTVLGDARIKLALSDKTFDVLLIDAFSSDAIPLHLVTVEAVDVYQDRLADDGVLLFHISNRFFNLDPVLARVAKATGLNAFVQRRGGSKEKPLAEGENPSVVVAMSKSAEPISALWVPLTADGQEPWTDDHASLLSALHVGGAH
ncbi:MAG: fused MFS/spermidine synthase [Pseudomonadota bacterium]